MAKRKRTLIENRDKSPFRVPKRHRLDRKAKAARSEAHQFIQKSEAAMAENKDNDARHVIILERKADLFSAPPGTVLLHSCNTIGSWGAGIAAVFKKRYKAAFKANIEHCKAPDSKVLGSALLISPENDDGHFIACLFTSTGIGRKKSKPDVIVKNSVIAMEELLAQIKDWNDREETMIERLWMCKINSGLFNVPWETTKAALEGIALPEGLTLEIVAVSQS